MTDTIELEAQGQLLEVSVTGKLTKDFYETFVPAVDQLLGDGKKVRILFRMHDFHGWTAGALWEDTKFALHHWNDIERLAIVGEKKWQHGMATFCKPFTSAKIEYFDHADVEKARAWLKG
jgi:hypothetical protein